MNTIRRRLSKVKKMSMPMILKANYILNNYGEVIWLIGDGRSGTTWISSLINHDKKYREMFEPFHPQLRGMHFFIPHEYIRPHGKNEKLRSVASDIFSGKFMDARVDNANRSLLYNGILIKDIFANLFSYWAWLQFPKIKPVLLIRNPFAVALSKYKKKHWFWVTEPLALLNQVALYEDYLLPFEDIIRKTSSEKNYILNQILIWSIINYVPLRQFKPGDIHVCFYEDIYTDPNLEISSIFQYVRGSSQNCQINLNMEIINRPSRVIGSESNLLSGFSPISSWKKELTSKQIDDGLEILQRFGFDNLYDDKSMPNRDALRKIHDFA